MDAITEERQLEMASALMAAATGSSTTRSGDVRLMDDTELSSKYSPEPPPAGGRCCARYGRTTVLCSLTKSYGYFPTTCHVGPHWACMLVTYCLAIGPAFLFFAYASSSLEPAIALLASICLTTASFTMVACSDPGVVFQDIETSSIQEQGDIEAGIICGRPTVHILTCRSVYLPNN
ncbi:hypothetical protein BBJ28_00023812 [Nothophytophthora sp. Chile5]|nr:hypothetical protein BBJ28_00023812 [Nothophytophthora sp. Chile5]